MISNATSKLLQVPKFRTYFTLDKNNILLNYISICNFGNIQAVYFQNLNYSNKFQAYEDGTVCRNFCTEQSKYQKTPKLYYVQNPFIYIKIRIKLLLLKLFWDWEFSNRNFIKGSTKAAVLLTDLIRTNQIDKIVDYTTPIGLSQITRDRFLSENDPRLQMVRFREFDIKEAIPLRVRLVKHKGKKQCVIDMFFVGLRNIKDFQERENGNEMERLLQKYVNFLTANSTDQSITNKIRTNALRLDDDLKRFIFVEVLVRFYRDYTDKNKLEDWDVTFYKIIKFDILVLNQR